MVRRKLQPDDELIECSECGANGESVEMASKGWSYDYDDEIWVCKDCLGRIVEKDAMAHLDDIEAEDYDWSP